MFDLENKIDVFGKLKQDCLELYDLFKRRCHPYTAAHRVGQIFRKGYWSNIVYDKNFYGGRDGGWWMGRGWGGVGWWGH